MVMYSIHLLHTAMMVEMSMEMAATIHVTLNQAGNVQEEIILVQIHVLIYVETV